MRLLRRAIAGILFGLALVFAAISPATAAEVATSVATQADVLTGTTWSAPAFPVDCRGSGGQVQCTPSDPNNVTAMECFTGVVMSGDRATVCTTYAGHVPAIQSAGGRSLMVKYGCSVGDAVCLTFETAGRGMAVSATGTMFLVADSMQFDSSSLLWDAAVNEWSFWQWAILIVTFAAMVWAITAAVVSGDRSELVGAVVRSFIAIPAVPLSLWLTGHLLNAVDEMTWYVMNRDGPFKLFATLQSVMWAGGQANYFFAFLIHGLLMIGMLLLMLVFAFRNIALAALIAVGPVAWMVFPVRGIGPQWVVRYVSAVVVLLLTGPLTIGFITLIINGLAGVKTIWDPQSWPLLVGLVLVAFAPFAIFGLFSFVGAVAADSHASRLGSQGARIAGNAARGVARIPTRFGGRPAGVRPTDGGSARSGASGRGPVSSSPSPRGASLPGRARPAVLQTSATTATSTASAPSQPPAPPRTPPTDRSSS